MNFNPDTTKQAQELIFSRKVKKKKKVHPPLLFNNAMLFGHLPKNTWELCLTFS